MMFFIIIIIIIINIIFILVKPTIKVKAGKGTEIDFNRVQAHFA